uniref:Uncharacterized protein n=1 Tax=Morchella brunnea TaxID=1174671 RepID=A0A8K1I7I0_9PEZI|nr:hypothetical protein LK370_mgp240 [Morchella brunnea]UBU98348.1 hypothetical protein [Morchella brunnea]
MTNRRLCMLGAYQVVFNPLLMSINSIITFKFEFSDYIIPPPPRLATSTPPPLLYSIPCLSPPAQRGKLCIPPDGPASDPKVTLGRGYYRVEKPYPPPYNGVVGCAFIFRPGHLHILRIPGHFFFYLRSKAAAKQKKMGSKKNYLLVPPPPPSLAHLEPAGEGVWVRCYPPPSLRMLLASLIQQPRSASAQPMLLVRNCRDTILGFFGPLGAREGQKNKENLSLWKRERERAVQTGRSPCMQPLSWLVLFLVPGSRPTTRK